MLKVNGVCQIAKVSATCSWFTARAANKKAVATARNNAMDFSPFTYLPGVLVTGLRVVLGGFRYFGLESLQCRVDSIPQFFAGFKVRYMLSR